jgi:hypothetical protein
MKKEEYHHESRNLDGRNVLFGYSDDGTLLSLYESLRKNIKNEAV